MEDDGSYEALLRGFARKRKASAEALLRGFARKRKASADEGEVGDASAAATDGRPAHRRARTAAESGPPPAGYVCDRCRSRDHYLADCPRRKHARHDGRLDDRRGAPPHYDDLGPPARYDDRAPPAPPHYDDRARLHVTTTAPLHCSHVTMTAARHDRRPTTAARRPRLATTTVVHRPAMATTARLALVPAAYLRHVAKAAIPAARAASS